MCSSPFFSCRNTICEPFSTKLPATTNIHWSGCITQKPICIVYLCDMRANPLTADGKKIVIYSLIDMVAESVNTSESSLNCNLKAFGCGDLRCWLVRGLSEVVHIWFDIRIAGGSARKCWKSTFIMPLGVYHCSN